MAILLAVGLDIVPASAQMFGPSRRTFGQPISRQPGFSRIGNGQGAAAAAAGSAGTLEGNERFLRRNRRPTDFVGPDLTELSRFIGNIQANMRRQVRPAAEDLRAPTDRSTTINRPRSPAPAGTLFDPRITLSFTPRVNRSEVAQRVVDVLADCPRLSDASQIEVSVEGRTAILQGVVPAESDRQLATLLVSFEPGISKVRNELRVNPQRDASADPFGGPTPGDATAARTVHPTRRRSPANWNMTPTGEGRQKWLTLSHATKPALTKSWEPNTRSRSY